MTDDDFDGVHFKPLTVLIHREFKTTPELTPEQFAGFSGMKLHRVKAIAAGRPITLTEAEIKQAEAAYGTIADAYWQAKYRREGWIFPEHTATGPLAPLLNLPKPPTPPLTVGRVIRKALLGTGAILLWLGCFMVMLPFAALLNYFLNNPDENYNDRVMLGLLLTPFLYLFH